MSYRLTIVAEEWNGSGIDYTQCIEDTETNKPDWDTDGIAEWINDGKDMEDLNEIIERADEHDIKFTFTISDENGNVTYEESMWESDAAKLAMEDVWNYEI